MVPSVLKGYVSDVSLQDVPKMPGEPIQVLDGASAPTVLPSEVDASYGYSAGLLRAKQAVTFTAAAADAPGRRFQWLFGDGTTAEGRVVRHAFPDSQGTLLDGSGRFRVLLHVTEASGAQSWSSQSIVLVADAPRVAAPVPARAAGQVLIDYPVEVPADGGYTFTLLSREPATLALDNGQPIPSPVPRARVCNADESAMQPTRISGALTAGTHHVHVLSGEAAPPLVLWEGPGLVRHPLAPASQP